MDVDKGSQWGTLSNEPDNAGLWFRKGLWATILLSPGLLNEQSHDGTAILRGHSNLATVSEYVQL